MGLLYKLSCVKGLKRQAKRSRKAKIPLKSKNHGKIWENHKRHIGNIQSLWLSSSRYKAHDRERVGYDKSAAYRGSNTYSFLCLKWCHRSRWWNHIHRPVWLHALAHSRKHDKADNRYRKDNCKPRSRTYRESAPEASSFAVY